MAQTKVIVIGGGLSGLSAAQLLDQMAVEVLVLEASDRIGGRLHTINNSTVSYTDVGGAYVGPDQKKILRLAEELNVKTYNVFTEKKIVHFRKGQTKKCEGSYFLPLSAGLLPFLDINNMMRTLDALAQTVSKSHPWEAPNAEVLDQMTFKEWLEKIMWTEHGMASARQFCEVNFTAEPHEISLLWALWYIKCAGGTASINSTEGGAQERKFIGGAQQIPIKIAETLGIGERVLTEKCVINIHQSQESVTVSTSDGHKYHGSHVVLAMPPALQRKIEFEPPLAGNRNQLIAKYPMGSVIKTMMFYDQPYWREKGFNGNMEVEDASLDFPIGNTADDCKPDGSKPCIMGFILGSKATKMSVLTKEERMKKIAKQYSVVFDSPEMEKPVHYEEKDWTSDPWTGGCYTGYLPPGVLTLYTDTLRRAAGRVYMAGTETATDWTGYMEGAVQTGQRAATQILIDLNIITESEVAKEKEEVIAESNLLLKYAPSVGGLLQVVAATAGVAVILLSKL